AFEVTSSITLPNITIPKAESNWIRMPTQVGDKGWTVPADAYLGAISGLGGGTPTLSRPHNLAALVFVPVSNKNDPPIDQNAAQIEGPNGAIIQTTEGSNTSSIVTDQNGTTVTYGNNTIAINNTSITLTAGGSSITINSSGIAFHGAVTGNSTATFTGEVKGNNVKLSTHDHSGVTTGSGTSGPPVSGT